MSTTFRPYQPDQLLLLAPDLQEWLPAGHLAHHVAIWLILWSWARSTRRTRVTVGAIRRTNRR